MAERRSLALALSACDPDLEQKPDQVLLVPSIHDLLSPLLTVLPLQLLAYHIALLHGCDVDQPRKLGKSVTSSSSGQGHGVGLARSIPFERYPLEPSSRRRFRAVTREKNPSARAGIATSVAFATEADSRNKGQSRSQLEQGRGRRFR
jgi:hypothetical protein